MAHTKAKGSTRLGRDSKSKRLGVKIFGGQKIKTGQIIVRQRGTQFYPGLNVGIGKDHTIFAKADGILIFESKKNNSHYNKAKRKVLISVKDIF